MESSLGLVLVLIATLSIVHIAQAHDQQGFLSLDCGLPANEQSPYNEKSTGLEFLSDATYIQSGKIDKIHANLESEYIKPLTTLRYFPDGKRNCYNLPVEKGRNHLIRASFLYGNYDGLNINPKFDLYFGPNLWATIDFEKVGNVSSTDEEIFHIPTSKSLQICLVKTEKTTFPLISTLEIRPMEKNSYETHSGSLNLFFRRYLSELRTKIRYPSDVDDRVWTPFFNKEWTKISTPSNLDNSNEYYLPKNALATAAIPTNSSAPLEIRWNSSNANDQYYVYIHFAELQESQANDTREFDMVWNGVVMSSDPVIPKKFTIHTVYSKSPTTFDGGECIFQLQRTKRSTLPPLLNALEVYTVIQLPQSETNETDVVAIKSIQETYGLNRINWQGDPCVPQHLSWDGLNCSNTDMSSMPPRITSLNLSSSGLTGTIAAAFQNLTQLERLDLSNNNLTGEVPEFLGNIKSLLVINLSGNNLHGSIPLALQRKGLNLSVERNPRLCDSCTKPTKKEVVVPIVASVASAAIVIAVLVIFLTLRKKKQTTIEGAHLPPKTPMRNVTLANSTEATFNQKRTRFTYSEVIEMTNNFQRVLGKGGFGMVYHGTVNGSEQVAVKLLSQSSTQGYKQFKAEVDLLLRVHHTNLVGLVGYCCEEDQLALIYEFMPNGDLKQHLSGKSGRSIINWNTRLQIALEAAQGLEYLHIGCKPPMVHRDVKSANILLDEHFKAKLADFGLSRSFHVGDEPQDYTAISGTPGYLDPEYYRTSRLGEKSDVHSFGIVLLEMITNQPVISQSTQSSENCHITEWVGLNLKRGDITQIMDPNLCGVYDTNSVWRALELAMSCANPSSSTRPSMSQVIHELKDCIVCENFRMSVNGGLESQELSISLDSSVRPMAR